MSRARAESLLRRQIYLHGSPVTVQHFTETDGGSRGPAYSEGDTDEIKAYPDTSGGNRQLGELLGVELSSDIAFHCLKDDLSDQLAGGGNTAASEVSYNGRSYVVEDVEDNGRPVVVLHCTTEQDN